MKSRLALSKAAVLVERTMLADFLRVPVPMPD